MRILHIITALCLIALTAAKHLTLIEGKQQHLMPKTGWGLTTERYDLTTCKGCKMILKCIFATYSCLMGKIVVDDGETTAEHCPEDIGVLMITSAQNRMSVTLHNLGQDLKLFCDVVSTKPYLGVSEPVINSQEHGVISKGTKRNTCKCGWSNKTPSRVVGGKLASVNEYSFIALLIFAYDGFPFCGGSIITERHVLTAAHCTYTTKQRIAVVVGEHDVTTWNESPYTSIHNVRYIYEHPAYTPRSNMADIAILELATSIEFNEAVGPVCLPSAQTDLLGEYIKVMGWGNVLDKSEGGQASPILSKVNLRVIDPDVCKVIYRIVTEPRTQICTYNDNKDSCEGDSGGPLVFLNKSTNTYYQVALVSYGMKCGSTNPAVNTDVGYFSKWIQRQIDSSRYPYPLCF